MLAFSWIAGAAALVWRAPWSWLGATLLLAVVAGALVLAPSAITRWWPATQAWMGLLLCVALGLAYILVSTLAPAAAVAVQDRGADTTVAAALLATLTDGRLWLLGVIITLASLGLLLAMLFPLGLLSNQCDAGLAKSLLAGWLALALSAWLFGLAPTLVVQDHLGVFAALGQSLSFAVTHALPLAILVGLSLPAGVLATVPVGLGWVALGPLLLALPVVLHQTWVNQGG